MEQRSTAKLFFPALVAPALFRNSHGSSFRDGYRTVVLLPRSASTMGLPWRCIERLPDHRRKQIFHRTHAAAEGAGRYLYAVLPRTNSADILDSPSLAP